jgi:hypothetical protein
MLEIEKFVGDKLTNIGAFSEGSNTFILKRRQAEHEEQQVYPLDKWVFEIYLPCCGGSDPDVAIFDPDIGETTLFPASDIVEKAIKDYSDNHGEEWAVRLKDLGMEVIEDIDQHGDYGFL